MNGETLIWLVIVAIGLLLVIDILWTALRGPDPDLEAPWSPGDPPDFRRRPCGESTCKLDHSTVNPWVEDRQR
jgi:hypothetical protein